MDRDNWLKLMDSMGGKIRNPTKMDRVDGRSQIQQAYLKDVGPGILSFILSNFIFNQSLSFLETITFNPPLH